MSDGWHGEIFVNAAYQDLQGYLKKKKNIQQTDCFLV